MNKTLLSLLLLVASLPAFAAPALTAAQEARVQELVQETLLKHPEILAAAAENWISKMRRPTSKCLIR